MKKMTSHSKNEPKAYEGMITHESADWWYHYDIVDNICKKFKKLEVKNYQDAIKEAIKIDKNKNNN